MVGCWEAGQVPVHQVDEVFGHFVVGVDLDPGSEVVDCCVDHGPVR